MSKSDCLVYEMLLIRELTPSLNVQSDSVQEKTILHDVEFVPPNRFIDLFVSSKTSNLWGILSVECRIQLHWRKIIELKGNGVRAKGTTIEEKLLGASLV